MTVDGGPASGASAEHPDGYGAFEIRVRGRLAAESWAFWIAGWTVVAGPSGETILRGTVADAAALYGLLAPLRDLALPLVSVNPL